MSSRQMIVIFALPLLDACANRDLVAPNTEDAGAIQAAKGGGKGPPDKGDGDDSGTWDGTQDIVYVESFSSKPRRQQSEDRLVVVGSDGSNAATVFSLPREDGSLNFARASLSPDGNAIVLDVYGGVHIIRRDPATGSISAPLLLVPDGSQQAVSPDGSRIAYVMTPASFCEGIAALDLYVFDRNDGTSTRITSNNQPAGCITTDSMTTLTPAWASDTEIAVIQSSFKDSENRHVAVFDVGTIVDGDGDGVIDDVTEKWSTTTGGGPDGLPVDLEWAPDASRAVVTAYGATVDLWIIEFSATSIQSCNITSAIDGRVGHASLGPGNRIVFRRGGGLREENSIVTGLIGSACPTTVLLDPDPLAMGSKNTTVARPNWKRPLP